VFDGAGSLCGFYNFLQKLCIFKHILVKLKFCLKTIKFLNNYKVCWCVPKTCILGVAPLLRYCTVYINNRAIIKIHHPDFINAEKRSGGQETPRK